MKTPRELLAEARADIVHSLGEPHDPATDRLADAMSAICDLLEQHQAWMDGARLVIEAHNDHAVRTIDEAAIRADERERIARLMEAGEFALGDSVAAYAIARRIREAKRVP